jgi:hypothetical protein
MMELIHQAIQTHRKLLKQFEAEQLDHLVAAANLLTDCLTGGGCIYLCGNGGSAADAQHIAGELVGRFLRNRKALPAVALTTDTSVLTAIANDFSYDAIFERQVQALVRPGIVSGPSPPAGPPKISWPPRVWPASKAQKSWPSPAAKTPPSKKSPMSPSSPTPQPPPPRRKSTNWPTTSSAILSNAAAANSESAILLPCPAVEVLKYVQ